MNNENDQELEAFREFVRSRINQLRLDKNISEYRLGLEIGKSQGYIQAISAGRNMPSMDSLHDICVYFQLSPSEFFDPSIKNPSLYHSIINIIKEMPDSDLKILLPLLNRYKELHSTRNPI